MYAEPSASRGKKKKGSAANDVAETKRQVQRATKTQRKVGGIRRGGDYEVEDVGGLFGNERGVAIASDKDSADESSDDSRDGGQADGAVLAARLDASLRADLTPGGSAHDEEVREIKESVREQLREWASDTGMPEDEKKRCVRQLLAQWHPDKNQHIHAAATEVFQFIQNEVNRIISELSGVAQKSAKKEADALERKAQRMADKSARASALKAAKDDKARRKGATDDGEVAAPMPEACEDEEEWSLVVGHGPATTAFLRPWPRSHFSLCMSPLAARAGEILLFGGEAYDGRELTFYSDLYRLNIHGAEATQALPWEKLYSSVPMIPGPEARSSHQAVVWDRWLYIFGGEWSSRDQKRYRQFNDFWRIDATAIPGTRWERIEALDAPSPRSGHRMAATRGGHAVMYGGFNEDRRRRATYLDDLNVVSLGGGAWRVLSCGDRRGPRPSKRAGHILWVTGGSAYVYGGTRPKTKGAEQMEVLEDLWRAEVCAPSAGSEARWEPMVPQGSGPGRRSGLCQCAVSERSPNRRLVYGGVTDVKVSANRSNAVGRKPPNEVALFHNDVFLLDCETGSSPMWSQLWPVPGNAAPRPVPSFDSALPQELLEKGGGIDAHALVALGDGSGATAARSPTPRGRIAAGCAVAGSRFFVFGGSCESGPRQEVTLDDLWWIALEHGEGGEVQCRGDWECVLRLSERATVWFDSDSDDDSDEGDDGQRDADVGKGTVVVVDRRGGVLSKKDQKEEAKKVRMELKREKQQEKCEEKLDKRAAKKEKQRLDAQAKAVKR